MPRFAVIGLGNFGFQITRSLYEEGNVVIAIDKDHDQIQSISPFCTQAVKMDASDREALNSLSLNLLDGVIVAVGNSISNSVLICLHLNELGVSKIIAKALDDDHAKILEKIGATEILRPERDMAMRLARNLSHPNIIDFLPVSDDFEIVQLTPPKSFMGKSLLELNLRGKHGIQVIAVKKPDSGRNELIPSANYVIGERDQLIILGETRNIRKIRNLNSDFTERKERKRRRFPFFRR